MMKIGIISAIYEEMSLLAEHLQSKTVATRGMRDYYSGILWGIPAVLVFCRIGKVAAAATAANLILEYNVDQIVFIGVAGSCSESVNVGDIVIGEKLYQHDMDASPIFQKYEIPLLEKISISTDEKSRQIFENISQQYLKNISEYVPENILNDFNISNPKAMKGDIASGDRFISKETDLRSIKEDLPSVLCVEMEGGAVAQVCYEYSVPFSVIRIISDSADENAHIDFQEFVDEIASTYSFEILKKYFNNELK